MYPNIATAMIPKKDEKGYLIRLKRLIQEQVFVRWDKERIVDEYGNEIRWLFDFRKVLLWPEVLEDLSYAFRECFKDEFPVQIGGLETAAIPIITGLIVNLTHQGIRTTGFFIRKSRKKVGLLRMIEGEVGDEKIILVDDLMSGGNSLIRQVEIIESLGKKVHAVFIVLRFHDIAYYKYFHERGIKIVSLFSLDDFKDSLHMTNLPDKNEIQPQMPFKVEWCVRSERPNYFYVVPKSAPAIDDSRVYFGTDSGIFWAINQLDGSAVWKYRVGLQSKGKYIFSSPAIYKNFVYFGSYDGNFYALDKETGKREWMFMDADWISSSPCVASELGLVFVGLEFGFWNKKGGIVALDAETGKEKWKYLVSGAVNSSPAYSKENNVVVCGSNNFSVYGFNPKNGKLLWEYKTEGEIMESFAFDEKCGVVCFGSFDKNLYVLKTTTGTLVHKIETGAGIYSTPIIYKDYVYVASLDKMIYCINLDTGAVVWKFATKGRIFASPEIAEGKLYIGSNDARLYELDPLTGKNTAFIQVTERITNKIAYNAKTKRFFLPTFANEIYCLLTKPK